MLVTRITADAAGAEADAVAGIEAEAGAGVDAEAGRREGGREGGGT